MDLNTFIEWQKQDSSRTVKVDIRDEGVVSIWVYNYKLGIGQYVSNTEEINLEALKDTQDLALFEKLKERYEHCDA